MILEAGSRKGGVLGDVFQDFCWQTLKGTDRNLCLNRCRSWERGELRLYIQGQKSEHNPELEEGPSKSVLSLPEAFLFN